MYAGQFRVDDLLGQGGMGEVYLVEHLTLKAEFALKVLRPQFQARQDIVTRFRAESRALWELKHPNVVKVHHAGEDPEIGPFMAMEVLRGKNLAQLMYAVGELPVDKAFQLVIDVAETVEAMHAIGIIHRDLKPENIFITTKPGEPRGVKLLDLGAAKIVKYNHPTTEQHKTIGTGKYMSPEHIRGTGLTNQSDVYALGHILYELVAGRHAFGAHHPGNPTHWDYQVWHLNAEPEPLTEILPGFPVEMWGVVERAIRKNPEERFESMQAFAAALRTELKRFLGQGGTQSLQSPPSSRAKMTLEAALSIPTPPGNWSATLIEEAIAASQSGPVAVSTAAPATRKRTERVAGGRDEPLTAVAELEVLEGKYAGKVFPLTIGSHVLGRDKECSISLEEGSLSGKHARIEVESADVWVIHDLGSTNGVEVQGQGIRSHVLSPGQRFRLGRNIFSMSRAGARPGAAPERVAPLARPLGTVKMEAVAPAGSAVNRSAAAPTDPVVVPKQAVGLGGTAVSGGAAAVTGSGTAISGSGPAVTGAASGSGSRHVAVNVAPAALVQTAPTGSGPAASPLPFAAVPRTRASNVPATAEMPTIRAGATPADGSATLDPAGRSYPGPAPITSLTPSPPAKPGGAALVVVAVVALLSILVGGLFALQHFGVLRLW